MSNHQNITPTGPGITVKDPSTEQTTYIPGKATHRLTSPTGILQFKVEQDTDEEPITVYVPANRYVVIVK